MPGSPPSTRHHVCSPSIGPSWSRPRPSRRCRRRPQVPWVEAAGQVREPCGLERFQRPGGEPGPRRREAAVPTGQSSPPKSFVVPTVRTSNAAASASCAALGIASSPLVGSDLSVRVSSPLVRRSWASADASSVATTSVCRRPADRFRGSAVPGPGGWLAWSTASCPRWGRGSPCPDLMPMSSCRCRPAGADPADTEPRRPRLGVPGRLRDADARADAGMEDA